MIAKAGSGESRLILATGYKEVLSGTLNRELGLPAPLDGNKGPKAHDVSGNHCGETGIPPLPEATSSFPCPPRHCTGLCVGEAEEENEYVTTVQFPDATGGCVGE